tara:strand:- start:22700 stop:23116 length:417 start_codon:yes stop_codon:yes gene_type:complete
MDKALATAIELEIPFHDVDSMNVVWHGHYTRYIELARCKLLESFGYGYREMWASGFLWPVVDLRLKYVRSARFGQIIRIEAHLVEWEYRLRIRYRIADAHSGEKLSTGYTTQVAVAADSGEMCYQSPPILAEKLESFL